MSVEIEIDPVPKPRMVKSDAWAQRPIVLNYWRFKDEINLLANKQNFILGEAYKVVFTIKMPDSWSKKKKKEYDGLPHQSRPDLDNLVKSINDCLSPEEDYQRGEEND